MKIQRWAALAAGTGLLLAMSTVALAAKGQPAFMPAVYADGAPFGTKFTTELPAPNGHNGQSYDALFVITNSNNPMGQLPVAEAGPGNTAYNGGRWAVHTATWTMSGFMDHGIVPVLTSNDEVMLHASLGHLDIVDGSFEGGPPAYFQCPLLPVK